MHNDYMTAEEVARNFFDGKLSYWTVLKRARAGILPCIRDGGRYLFKRSVLEAWEKAALSRPTWMPIN